MMFCSKKWLALAILLAGSVILSSYGEVSACSRVLWSDNGQAVLCGRNMDWPDNTPTDLWVLPRGMKRTGLISNNPLTWTSKYGSLVAVSTMLGKSMVSDGLNEKGLGVNALWLEASDYGARDPKLPGLSISLWAQYCLDNFATVQEVLDSLKKHPYQIVTLSVPVGHSMDKAMIHLSLEDRTGDSAIIEYENGKPVVHHGKNYAVMTNDPPLDQQLSNLAQYEGFGGKKPLPGTTQASDRFVRASYYLKYLPKPQTYRESVAAIFSIMRNVSQPFRDASDPKHYISSTIWRTVADLNYNVYFFESTESPNVVWADLNKFNINEGSSPMKIALSTNWDLTGDVSSQAVRSEPFEFMSSELDIQKLIKEQNK